jgi:5-methylcytosine-specific restriction endonuclease McrA
VDDTSGWACTPTGSRKGWSEGCLTGRSPGVPGLDVRSRFPGAVGVPNIWPRVIASARQLANVATTRPGMNSRAKFWKKNPIVGDAAARRPWPPISFPGRAVGRTSGPMSGGRANLVIDATRSRITAGAMRKRIDTGVCRVRGCGQRSARKRANWCAMHYARLYRHGDVAAGFIYDGHCRQCGAVIIGRRRRFCSRRCVARHARGILESERDRRTCGACGVTLPSGSWSTRVFCSPACRDHAAGSRFNPVIIGDRDGWVCHLCGKKVRREDASIDHLIPVADGGPNILSNVALAHMRCNARRGRNRMAAQLRMIG